MKLQDAYVAETGAVGSWTKIGYQMKDGDTFDYNDDMGGSNTVMVENLSAGEGSSGTLGWSAKNKVKLNDCPNNQSWTITMAAAASSGQGGMISYAAAAPGTGDTRPCAELTPSFEKLSSN